MPFYLSPSVNVLEKDLTSIVPAISTSVGAFAGPFSWGPVEDPVTVSSENVLVQRFGKPTDKNFHSFFTAANFLSYSNNLLLIRSDAPELKNAVSRTTTMVEQASVDGVTASLTSRIVTGTAATPGTPSSEFLTNVSVGDMLVTTSGVLIGVVASVISNVELELQTNAQSVVSNGDVKVYREQSGLVQGVTSSLTSKTVNGSDLVTGTVESKFLTNVSVGDMLVTTSGDLIGIVDSITSDTQLELTANALQVVTTGDIKVYREQSGLVQGVTSSLTSKTVNGSSGTVGLLGSRFLTSVSAGDTLRSSSGALIGVVATVNSNTQLELTANSQAAVSSATVKRYSTQVTTKTAIKIKNEDVYMNQYVNGLGSVGEFAAKYPGEFGNSLKVSMCDDSNYANWEYKDEFDSAPGTTSYASKIDGKDDGLHIVVVDEDGVWTGTKGFILEKFAYVSKASDAVKSDGTNNFYKNVLNTTSRYVWWMDHPVGMSNWGHSAAKTTFTSLPYSFNVSLEGGKDDFDSTNNELISAYSLFANDELYDISLVMTGKASTVVAKYVIENVAEIRKDCVVFVSPYDGAEVIQGSGSDAVNKIVSFRDAMPSTSYAVMDTGCKYQYDRYNDVYRWVPLNGDVAGLCARTDYTNDAWWSPAGYNRGQIKNVVKLAVNPGKTERDNLYKKGVNPVVNFPGNGVVLFGDKTLLATPSAFDRINVRRLFIVLEKSIATAAKYQLFEFNDGFTRAQFKNLIEPFLRDVQGRRGIIDFRVKCDESNNTGEVIDRNEFVADIFVKPSRAINFITLNFVAARTAISFEEIGA